ncbi:MAG: energy transducer TonB, partial [Pseudomonadales bacterium]|nr:energy transducer TonB [Pseudomonadales bacterium]
MPLGKCVALAVLLLGFACETTADVLFPSCRSGTDEAETITDYLPVNKVQPRYPHSALAKNIQGYARVRFTVTAEGKTADFEIAGSWPPGVFDDAAIRAVKQFTYEPRRVDGVAVATPGVTNLITFLIDGNVKASQARDIEEVRQDVANEHYEKALATIANLMKGRDVSDPTD